MKKLTWILKYDLKWYLDHYLTKNKETAEQCKEVIEILKIILGESKDSKTALVAVSAVNAVVTIDAKSLQEAIPRLVHLAEGGNPQSVEATYLLGIIYRYGIGVPYDGKRAAEHFQTAAKSEHAPALVMLGGCYSHGIGLGEDLKRALDCYELSVNKGWAPAYYALAHCFDYGRVVAKDMRRAVHYYNLATEQGFAPAQGDLAVCFKNGLGVQKDLKRALVLYESAASKGCITAQANLGSCYLNGTFGTNLEQAFHYIILALIGGHQGAHTNLGFCYARGVGVGFDFKRAVEFYTLSASQGSNDARNSLALIYLAGIGVVPDFLRATVLFYTIREKMSGLSAKFEVKFFYAALQNEKFLEEFNENNNIYFTINSKINEIDKIEDKYIEYFPYAAFIYQFNNELETAEKLYLKAIEYYKKKGDLQTISRLHWDLYFCYQCQKQNDSDEEDFRLGFDAKILTEFYEKINLSVNEGNYHDLELLAYMNEKSEINSEGNWCAAVQCYHRYLDQVQKEMGEVRDTVISDKTGLKEDGGWIKALEEIHSAEILKMIDSRNSPEQALRVRQRKIENAKRKIALFTPLLDLQREIETTGLNKSLSALVVAYAMDADVMQIAPLSNLPFIPFSELKNAIQIGTGLDKGISALVAAYAMDADQYQNIKPS